LTGIQRDKHTERLRERELTDRQRDIQTYIKRDRERNVYRQRARDTKRERERELTNGQRDRERES